MRNWRRMKTKYNGKCKTCPTKFIEGDEIFWRKGDGAICPTCHENPPETIDLKPQPLAAPVDNALQVSPLPLSKYQQKVIDAVRNAKAGDHFIVEAVAGSGKTFTMIQAIARLLADTATAGLTVLFLAFNKSIAGELAIKVRSASNVTASTTHSFGLKICRDFFGARFKINNDKTRRILFNKIYDYSMDTPKIKKQCRRIAGPIIKLISLAKNHSIFSADDLQSCWKQLANKFDVSVPDDVIDVSAFEVRLLETFELCLDQTNVLDFDDMIYYPVLHNMSVGQYDRIMIDEAQDMSPVQIDFINMLAAGGGSIICVGDTSQSIYGFRGADTSSMANIKKALDATELPLSICYRCPRKVIELAKTIVPHIEAAPGAIDGVLETITEEIFWKEVRVNDYVICRTTAPLVITCLRLIAAGRKAMIMGRDIGKDLISLIDNICDRNGYVTDMGDFLKCLGEYYDREYAKLIEQQNSEMKLQALQDRVDTINALAEGQSTVHQMKERITKIFSDDADGIVLSTVHKAKGLEAERIFILRYDLMPHPMAKVQVDPKTGKKDDWQIVQEEWLRYVAITRSQGELYLVPGKE